MMLSLKVEACRDYHHFSCIITIIFTAVLFIIMTNWYNNNNHNTAVKIILPPLDSPRQDGSIGGQISNLSIYND